jgi:hypothetical protein
MEAIIWKTDMDTLKYILGKWILLISANVIELRQDPIHFQGSALAELGLLGCDDRTAR